MYDLAECVGIRRDEYKHLCRNDLVYDESGYLCVRVKRGKGGKYREQRLLPGDEAFVASFFDNSDERISTKNEMANKIDLHHLRALQAQRLYHYYLTRLENEPDYREQLTREVKVRWERFHPVRAKKEEEEQGWNPKKVTGIYALRGQNRAFALANGLPVHYDRLAVMAVSMFHPSHWRCDVTVNNYLMAV